MLSIFNSNFFGSVCAFVEIVYLYFFIFKANLLSLSQSLILIIYLFTFGINDRDSRDIVRITIG